MTARQPSPRSRALRWSHLTLLGIPLLVVVLVAGLAMAAVQIQAGTRAYEIGTNQASTARVQAINALLRYARSHHPADWADYREAMRLPDSARQTRDILRQYGPDGLPQVEKLLVDAGQHPDDVKAMFRLYRWLGTRFLAPITRDAWRQTDAMVRQLDQEALLLRAVVQAGGPPEQVGQILQRIGVLDTSLRKATKELADSWAKASRTTTTVLLLGIALTALLLTLGSALLIRRALNRQIRYTRSLTEARRRWELASSAAGLGLYQMDAATGTIQLDGPAAAMHGLGLQGLSLGRTALRALIVEEDVRRTQHEVDEVLQVGHDYRITYRVRHPNGQVRTLEACGRRVSPDRGNTACLIGVVRDVTDAAHQAEQTLKREAAERVAQAQRSFLSRLSHELRTPLNAILGFAQLLGLDARPSLSDAQRQQVHWILTSGQQLLALIEDVLDLSKVESGEISLHLARVDVNALLRECLPLLEAARQEHQITILNRAEDAPLHAWIDAQRLRQIAINLLSNACKYNRPHGHVTIDTRAEGDDIVIDISDDGIGMRAEDLSQLFQAFKRLPSAMTHAEGTGLGLYIVKQLVDSMQGNVSVTSELGVGTRFSVRLPRFTETADTPAPPVTVTRVTQSSSS